MQTKFGSVPVQYGSKLAIMVIIFLRNKVCGKMLHLECDVDMVYVRTWLKNSLACFYVLGYYFRDVGHSGIDHEREQRGFCQNHYP